MKYYTWKINWADGVGTDPTAYNTDEIRLEPNFADADSTIYGYLLRGTLNPLAVDTFAMVEITLGDMLAAALKVNPLAYEINGFVRFPEKLPNAT